ncbi:multidrug effflux MFS transporter [Paenibacillus turicensis]|uniref:multidrug effflux MFS transporter n=1 Tax=Paenibacillus turicensis TaxID=160487 RepID=UPI003D2C79AF
MEKNIRTIQTQKISLALLVCLVGFPQISETIYTPSLTDIAQGYQVTLNVAQTTLSIYFLGFALGVFFWGIISDYIGRRKAMNFGVAIYILGCLLCLVSSNIAMLFIGRLIQAFGASTGSVTTQTILRDNYHGNERHQLFAKISAALAFSPAIGPLLGGFIGQYYGFRTVFLSLVLMGMGLLFWSLKSLPETSQPNHTGFDTKEILAIGKRILVDPYTITFGILIGIFNGILFSYHAEAPGIFMEKFHFSQSKYGFMGCVVATATILGAWLSSRALKNQSPNTIIKNGIKLSIAGTVFLSSTALLLLPQAIQVILYIAGIFIILAGIGIALPNCLSLALVKFREAAGTAGAFLSLGYYIIVSICTFLISLLHTGSILVFPLFCLVLLIVSLFLITLTSKSS